MDINNVWNVLNDHASHVSASVNARDALEIIKRKARPSLDQRDWYTAVSIDGTPYISARGINTAFYLKKNGSKWVFDKR